MITPKYTPEQADLLMKLLDAMNPTNLATARQFILIQDETKRAIDAFNTPTKPQSKAQE